MAAKFQISNIVPERTISTDGIYTYDMGVNPLSVILINLRPLNETSSITNFANAYKLSQAINRVQFLRRSESIISMRGEDIAAFNYYRWGMIPYQGAFSNVDNARRCLTIPIVMGRYPYSAKSCFPSSLKGESILELDLDVADTGYDNFNISVDAIELPGAKPTEFEKRVQQSLTFSATGDNDMDLPLGNLIRGMLLYGTTGYTGATPAPTWGSLSVLMDNQEAGVRNMTWEVLQTLQTLWGRLPPNPSEAESIFGTVVTTAGAAVWPSGVGGGMNTNTTYNNYAFVDYDPTGDDNYVLDARGAKSLKLRASVETANAVRCVPIEVIRP